MSNPGPNVSSSANLVSQYRGSMSDGETYVSILNFAAPGSGIDHTQDIQQAANYCASQGVSLYLDPGIYNFSSNISLPCSLIGAGRDLVTLNKTTADGKNARISIAVNNVTVRDIFFNSVNTPANPSNDGTENDGGLIFSLSTTNTLSNCSVLYCDFNNFYGPTVLFRNMLGGRMIGNRCYNAWKDSFHITGLSSGIVRANNLVENGGDDAFPVVGYFAGSSPGQPTDILDVGNIVRGTKTSRGFAYVGCKRVKNVCCEVDGMVPASYTAPNGGPITTVGTSAGLMITQDSSFNTYGCEDIAVEGMNILNCGRTGTPALNIVGHTAASPKQIRNISLRDIKITNSGNNAVFAQGGVAQGIADLTLDNVEMTDNTDPNNVTGGGAGTSVKTGMEFHNVQNLEVNGRINDSGGDALFGDTLSGIVKIDIKTRRINAANKASARMISLGTNTQIESLWMSLSVDEQAQVASSGTQYFIDRLILLNGTTAGNVRDITITQSQVGAPTFDHACVMNVAAQSISVTGSPFTYTNTGNYKQIVRVSGGTVSSITRGKTTGVGTPVYGATNTVGWWTLDSGDSLVVTYSVTPTMTWFPCQC